MIKTEWVRSPSNDLSYHISCWSKAVLNEAKTSQKFCGCPEKDSLYFGAFYIIFDIYKHLNRIIHSQKNGGWFCPATKLVAHVL